MPAQSRDSWLAGCDNHSDDCWWGWFPRRDFGLALVGDDGGGVGVAGVPDSCRKEVYDRDRGEEMEEGQSRSVSISNSGTIAFIHRWFADSD